MRKPDSPVLLSSLLLCFFLCWMQVSAFGQHDSSYEKASSYKKDSSNKNEVPPLAPRLTPVETVVSAETATGFGGPYACDDDGDIYLRIGSPGSPIRKLNPKGERVALFQTDANPDLEVGVAGYFSVTPEGELYQLVFARKEISRYVFIFKPDGAYKAKIKLQLPFAWMPSSLAVFPNGTMLITGQRYDRDTHEMKLPFTGIFSADGRLLKELNLEDDSAIRSKAGFGSDKPNTPVPVSSAGSQAINWGQIQSAKDGNLYVMRALSPAVFYAISPGGEVVRRFTVDSGQPSYRPNLMHISGNRIAVLFFDPQTMDKAMKVVDLEGEEIASYEQLKAEEKAAPGPLGLVFACYTQKPERFTFLATDEKHRIQLKQVEAR